MKKMKIYFYGEIYNIRNSYDIYHTRRKQRAEKKRFMNTTTKQKIRTSIKKIKKKYEIVSYIIYEVKYIYICSYIYTHLNTLYDIINIRTITQLVRERKT